MSILNAPLGGDSELIAHQEATINRLDGPLRAPGRLVYQDILVGKQYKIHCFMLVLAM